MNGTNIESINQPQLKSNIHYNRGLYKISKLTEEYPLLYTFPYHSIRLSLFCYNTYLKISYIAKAREQVHTGHNLTGDGLIQLTGAQINNKLCWTRMIPPNEYSFFSIPICGEYGFIKLEVVDLNGNLHGAVPANSHIYIKSLLTMNSDGCNPDGLTS